MGVCQALPDGGWMIGAHWEPEKCVLMQLCVLQAPMGAGRSNERAPVEESLICWVPSGSDPLLVGV